MAVAFSKFVILDLIIVFTTRLASSFANASLPSFVLAFRLLEELEEELELEDELEELLLPLELEFLLEAVVAGFVI